MRFFPRCSIFCRVSISTLSRLVAQPSSFVYHMGAEYPQTPSIVPEQLHLVLSCAESFREQLCRKSLMEPGNGMVPKLQISYERFSATYTSRVVTTTFTEVRMELEFVSEEFSRDIEFLTTDNDNVLTIENLFCNSRGKTTYLLQLHRMYGTNPKGVLCRR